MSRTITRDEGVVQSFGLARMEDVNYDDMKKKWMESADKIELPKDTRTQEEIQADNEFIEAAKFVDFWGIEGVAISETGGQEAMMEMAAMIEAVNKEEIQYMNEIIEKVIEEDAGEKIEQMTAFVTEEDDPLLEKRFEEAATKLIEKIFMEDIKREGTDDKREEDSTWKEDVKSFYTGGSSSSSKSDPWASSSSSRTASSTSATTSTVTMDEMERRDKQNHMVMTKMRDNVLDMAVNAPKWKDEKKEKPIHYFGGKKKRNLKYYMASIKSWFRSKKGKATWKIGIALCMELALGVITKKIELEGPMQMLSYLGMSLGVFYVGSELYGEGYDMRRLRMF